MKLLLIVSLCAFGALADWDDKFQDFDDDLKPEMKYHALIANLNLARDRLKFMGERAKAVRRREGIENPDDSDIHVPDEITADGILLDNFMEQENEGGSTQRTLTCKEVLQAHSAQPRVSVIEKQIPRLGAVREMMKFKNDMFRNKLKYQNKISSVQLGEWILTSDRGSFSRAKSSRSSFSGFTRRE